MVTHSNKEIINDLIAQVAELQILVNSHRAYKNNKIDLAKAEAIAQLLIKNKQALSLANKNLDGNLSEDKFVKNKLLEQQSIIEAFIDFPEDNLGDDQILQVIKSPKD